MHSPTETETEGGASDGGVTLFSRRPALSTPPPKAGNMPPPGRVPITQQGKAPPNQGPIAQAVAARTLARAQGIANRRQDAQSSAWSRPLGDGGTIDELDPSI